MNMANTYIPAMFQARGLAIHTVSNILFWAVLCEVPVVFSLIYLWTVSAIKFS